MGEREYVYRTYKTSINIWFYSYFGDTATHKLPEGFIPVLVGIYYSIGTFFYGFLTSNINGIKRLCEAIGVNLTGGEDFTSMMEEMDFDDRTKYVHQNLLRETQKAVDLEEVSLILEIQDIYSRRFENNFSKENIDFIIQSLAKIEIHYIDRNQIRDILDGLRLYEESITNPET